MARPGPRGERGTPRPQDRADREALRDVVDGDRDRDQRREGRAAREGGPYRDALGDREHGHVDSVTQIGVRTLNHAQSEVARRHPGRLAIVEARDLHAGAILEHGDMPGILRPGARVWMTVDLDVFDPAFAPGVAHPVPGGLGPRQAFELIQESGWDLVGMDVVECLPERDEGDRTAILAARLLHEAMGTVAS